MLLLAQLGLLATVIWFYMTAKEQGEPMLKWAFIGFLGYAITWLVIKLAVVAPLVGLFGKHFLGIFIVTQIPALCALAVVVLVRKKLLADSTDKSV
jgi:hypothetical protein